MIASRWERWAELRRRRMRPNRTLEIKKHRNRLSRRSAPEIVRGALAAPRHSRPPRSALRRLGAFR
jgi:hypothetical protein